jgi:hypothetical protein
MAHLRKIHVSLSVVGEEQVLVLSISLDPHPVLFVLHKAVVSWRTPVTRVCTEQHLLEVSVVKHVGVQSPS